MKKSLITLHTEDTNALFDNIFNDEIIIEPNSELAFHSCCLRLNNHALKIILAENELGYKVMIISLFYYKYIQHRLCSILSRLVNMESIR